MDADRITLEAYGALSDEDRERIRLQAAESHLDATLAALCETPVVRLMGTMNHDEVMMESVAAHCRTDRGTVEKIIASFARLIAEDVAKTGKAKFPGIGTLHRSTSDSHPNGALVVDMSDDFEKAIDR